MAVSNVAGIIRQHGAEQAAAPAIVYGDRTITYGELDERSNRFANGLLAEGVRSQQRVAWLDKNAPEYFDALFGATKVNAVLCAVNWRLAPREAAFIINDSQATVLVIGEELLPMLDAMSGELTTVKRVLVVGDGAVGSDRIAYESWLASQAATDPGAEATLDDVSFQFYSSGTTGRPKGVMLTNHNLFASVDANNEALGFGPSSVNLVVMPLFHVAGGAWALLGLYNGVNNVLMRDVDPVALVRLIPEYRVTHAVLVPAVIQFVLMVPGVDDADFSSLELIVYGASPISQQVLKGAIKLFGCDFMQAYGMTETTGGCVLL